LLYWERHVSGITIIRYVIINKTKNGMLKIFKFFGFKFFLKFVTATEAMNRRTTDNPCPKRKRTNGQTANKALHRKLKIEKYASHKKLR
jgi:hypothetical protein